MCCLRSIFFQLQSGTFKSNRNLRWGASPRQPIWSGSQSGLLETVPVLPADDEPGCHVRYPAEGLDQLPTHGFRSVHMFAPSGPDERRHGQGDHLLGRYSGEVRFHLVLIPRHEESAVVLGKLPLVLYSAISGSQSREREKGARWYREPHENRCLMWSFSPFRPLPQRR